MPILVSNGQIAPLFMRIEQFCEAFGLSRRTYSRMRAAGDGPAVTWLSGKQVILKRNVDEWVYRRTERQGEPGRLRHAS